MASREELGRLDLMPKSDIDKLGQLLTNAEALISLLDGGSGGGGYFLTVIDEQDNMTHTVTEIYEAYEDGLVPIVSDGERIYQLAYVVVADEIPTLKFTNAEIADSGASWGIQTFVLSIADNIDTVTYVQGGGSIGG